MISRGQVSGRQSGDDCSGTLQHLRIICSVHANHRIILQDCSQQLQWSQDCIWWSLHWSPGHHLPRLPHALLRLHTQGHPGRCHHDRGHLQCGAPCRQTHVVKQKYKIFFFYLNIILFLQRLICCPGLFVSSLDCCMSWSTGYSPEWGLTSSLFSTTAPDPE